MSFYLSMKDITKVFPGVVANDKVSLDLVKGEVHALLGENGAGKSTLMHILCGLYLPSSGEIFLEGNRVDINSPGKAIKLGIGMVHQHFMLIPALTVLENMVLGMPQKVEPFINFKDLARDIQNLASKYDMKIDPYAKISQLSVGEQQRVEIIKALYRGAKLLILDEPTAVLTPQETKEMYNIIHTLTNEGKTVIFITHKLNEVIAVSNKITILRRGKKIATVNNSEITKEELARLMVGRDIALCVAKSKEKSSKVVLDVKNLNVIGNKGLMSVHDISFQVKDGEILGIAGVDGNGQSELIEAITGLRPISRGNVQMDGKDITNMHPKDILESKISHIPEDRHLRGLVTSANLMENAILINYQDPPISKRGIIRWKKARDFTTKLINDFDVRTPSENVLAKNLSGGNQQKLILARELDRDPRLLIAMHPTRGLDIGAIEFIYKKIAAQRDKGSAVLLVSTELDEILTLSDRIAVLYEGKIMGIIKCSDANSEKLGLMMAGTKLDKINNAKTKAEAESGGY